MNAEGDPEGDSGDHPLSVPPEAVQKSTSMASLQAACSVGFLTFHSHICPEGSFLDPHVSGLPSFP